jgi:hypothetical protein
MIIRVGRVACHPPLDKAFFAKSSRSDGCVLNGGTSPVLSFQSISRWYMAHCGVFLLAIFGFFGSDMLKRKKDKTYMYKPSSPVVVFIHHISISA